MSPPAGQGPVPALPRRSVTPDDFELVAVDVPAPSPGEVLVRNEWTSVDPGMRLRLRPDARRGYFPAFPLGRAMDGIMTIGRVIASRAEGFRTATWYGTPRAGGSTRSSRPASPSWAGWAP